MVIDSPWPWKNYTAALNPRQPEAKYNTMSLAQIAALPVRSWLKPGGVVFAFYTWPYFADAPNIFVHSWGLRPQTGGVWGKRTKNGLLSMGTGEVIRGACEPFAILQNGTGRGLRARSTRNLIEAVAEQELAGKVSGHSVKPQEIYDMLVANTSGWRRADVFARIDRRPLFDCYGDQIRLAA